MDTTVKKKPDFDRVRDPNRIVGLMEKLRETRALVQVRIPGEKQPYISSILEIDTKRGHLFLDELNRTAGHEQLLKQKKLHISAQIQGVNIRFTLTMNKALKRGNIYVYRTPLPDLIIYEQRRNAFRVYVGPSMSIRVTFRDEDGRQFEGELQDISLTGIRARIPIETALTDRETPLECSVHLSASESINAEFETRFLKEDKQKRHLLLGGRLLNLTKSQRNQLSRFVMHLQRELIKYQPPT